MAEPEPPKETKQELIQAAKQLPPTEIFSLKPRTFDEAFRFANLIAESTLIPAEFRKQPANVLVAVQLGMELGVSPMQALQNIYVVNGRPSIFGDLLPAIVLASGLCESIDEQGDEKSASCTVKRKGMPAITRTFSMVEAERAKLPERNPTYKSYPKRMLQMRARAYAMRDMFPDVLKGVAIKEDIEDIEMRDVTPHSEPIKTPQALPAQSKGDPGVEGVRQPLGSIEKGKDDGSKSISETTEVRGAGGVGATSDQRSANTGSGGTVTEKAARKKRTELASVPTEKQEAPAEKSQDDIIAECLLWVENCTIEELTSEHPWVMQQLKQVKGTENQLKVLRPYNDRRQKSLIGAKT